MKVHLGK